MNREGKIITDYGITDKLYRFLLRPLAEFQREVKSFDKRENWWEGFEKLKEKYNGKTFRGKIVDLLPRNVDMEVLNRLQDYTYLIQFINETSFSKLKSAIYIPHKKMIIIYFNLGLPFAIGDRAFLLQQRSKLLNDIKRTDLSIRHELTHLFRDAETKHILKFSEKMKRFPKTKSYYDDRGHLELDFEIDAILSSIDRLKRRLPSKVWDEMTIEDLKNKMPGMRFPKQGDPMRSKWIKRMYRENLLSKKMKSDLLRRVATTKRSLAMDTMKVARELVKVARLLEEIDETRLAARWETMPKGWTDESRKKFWETLTGDAKHKVTKCIKKMEGKVSDPGAFCAALADRIEGTTKWRGKKK